MRSTGYFVLILAAISCMGGLVAAQDPAQGRVVALDGGASDLLKAVCPNTAHESLIVSNSESYQVLNRRALSMRDASCLIYRGDQFSVTAQMFRERLTSQGVHAIDLAAYAAKRKRAPERFRVADGDLPQVSEQGSFVMSLAIDQFRKVTNGL